MSPHAFSAGVPRVHSLEPPGATDAPGSALERDLLDEHCGAVAALYERRQWTFANAGPDLGWPDAARTEARLLAHADAVALLGRAARATLHECLQRSLDDGVDVFGFAFPLCLRDGADGIDAVLAALGRAGERARDALADALALAPQSEIACRLGPLAEEGTVAVRVVVAGILRRRGESAPGLLTRLLSSAEPAVKAAALDALAREGDSTALRAVVRLLDAGDAGVLGVATRAAMTLAGLPGAREACEAALARGDAAAGRLLVMRGHAAALRQVVAQALAAPSPEAIATLGIAGTRDACEALASVLALEAPSLASPARAALGRVLGAPPSPETDPGKVRAALGRPGGAPRPGERWRLGRPLVAGALLADAAAPASPLALRRAAAEEWRVLRARPLRFEPDGWIAHQRAALEAWGAVSGGDAT
jgi:hypothetical protein